VKNELACVVLPSASISFLRENKTARTTASVMSMTFPPIISPKESWGMPLMAEIIPTAKLGKDAAKAITKKATTNSVSFKNFAVLISERTIISPEKYKITAQTKKYETYKYAIEC
jgi:hypothetical protein